MIKLEQGIFLDEFKGASGNACGTQRMINQLELTMGRKSMSQGAEHEHNRSFEVEA